METSDIPAQVQPVPRDSIADRPDIECDVLIIYATSTEEDKLKEAAIEIGNQFQSARFGGIQYFIIGQVGSFRVVSVKTRMGPLTYQGSASTAIIAKSQTGATALICLGMAFGVDRATQKHGDVLVSRLLFHYDNREVECGENGEIRTNYQEARFEPKTSILGVLEQEHARRDYSARVQFGALLTGGAKIRCARFRDELAKPLSEFGELVIGGEMEGAGLVAASQREDPSWIVVKGISDFADHLRDEEIDQYRPVACANSARFVLSALKNYSVAAEE